MILVLRWPLPLARSCWSPWRSWRGQPWRSRSSPWERAAANYSFLAGLLMSFGLYGFSLWATWRDPEMLRILLASSRLRGRYDPGKHAPVDLEVRPC